MLKLNNHFNAVEAAEVLGLHRATVERMCRGNRIVAKKDIIKEVNHPNVWLQYDIYHTQIMEGNLTKSIRDNIRKIGHIQLADVPGRHEPGTGEINFTNLFRFIDEAGYNGWIGCEYKPIGKTEDGLEWVRPYLEKGGK